MVGEDVVLAIRVPRANRYQKPKKLKEQQDDKAKRSVVRGETADELIKNIREVNWNKVAEEVRTRAGGKIDFGV